nr:guanylate kinase [Brevibacterium sp. RIT 803]
MPCWRNTPECVNNRSVNNRLTVLAGPTAVGKGTISAYIRDHHPEVWFSVSATTRPRRPGEIDGVHYHFISDDEFDSLIAGGELLEYAVVHGRHRYGTPSAQVQEKLSQGIPSLLEIDLQGARQVKDKMPDALYVFLSPPSWEELVSRLTGRGTETAVEQERRLTTAKQELQAESEFDVTIVNDHVRTAAEELISLMGIPTTD